MSKDEVWDDFKKRSRMRQENPQAFREALESKREQLLDSLNSVGERVEAFISDVEDEDGEAVAEGQPTTETATETTEETSTTGSQPTPETSVHHEILEGFLRLTNKVLELEQRLLVIEKSESAESKDGEVEMAKETDANSDTDTQA